MSQQDNNRRGPRTGAPPRSPRGDTPAGARGGRDARSSRDTRDTGGGRPARDERKATPFRKGSTAAAQRQTAAPTRPVAFAAIRLEQLRSVLGEILQWAYPADAVLSRWFKQHPKLGMRDRGEIAEAVFDVLRHLRRYRQYAESGSGPSARRLAILGLDATLGGEALRDALSAEETQWLDRVRGIDVDTLSPAVRHSVPDWLEERLMALPDAEALIQALNQPAPLDLRVNPLKAERADVLAQLQSGPAQRYDPQPTPYSPWGIRLQGRPAVNRWPLFESGQIEVQDEGSQLLSALTGPKRGEMVIDYCAGAGGKSLLMGAMMRSTGRLYAFDVSAARLARAKPRFARSGLSNVVPVVIDAQNDTRVKRLRGKAHRVLVDAPCSGLGTLRRNPDLKWRQHPEALAELQAVQARILRQAAACVAPGGRLVYATCSLLPEENQQQVEAFLAENPDFTLLDAAEILGERCGNPTFDNRYLTLRPDRHGTDGFFAAAMERKKPSDSQKASQTVQEAPQDAEAGGDA